MENIHRLVRDEIPYCFEKEVGIIYYLKKLIQEAERLAREQGAITIILNSGNLEERKGAYQFYLSMGYAAKSVEF